MEYLHMATIFSGALVCLLASLLLFARRKTGERSRVILATIILFSVFNYIPRFIALCNSEVPDFVVSTKLLLVANFMIISYILYPIEVISPGWLNFWRIIKLYGILIVLTGIFVVSLWLGVEYTPYGSLIELLPAANRFEVWFRLILVLLIFCPLFFVFFMHKTQLYHNSDRVWMRKYVATLSINIIAYLLVLIFRHPIVHTLYYYVSVGCSLYIAYMELFDRLIGKPVITAPLVEQEMHVQETSEEPKNSVLIQRLNHYMVNHSAWRDPDLSLNTLASELFTNRTTLAQALRENGYENYTNYINRLRIDDFLQQIQSGQVDNYQDAFFSAGFRSRATALRNFRQFTGTVPSEYFQKHKK